MKPFNRINSTYLVSALILGTLFVSNSNAALISCKDTSLNYMQIDDSTVSSCIDAGTGNISGNAKTDDWLTSATGTGYSLVGKDDGANPYSILTTQVTKTKSSTSGTWSIDASYWNDFGSGALGFKFGTGNQPDEWFIFDLVVGATSGNWLFQNSFGKGGGLSHTNLYSNKKPPSSVPEPSIVALFGVGLLGLGFARRRKS